MRKPGFVFGFVSVQEFCRCFLKHNAPSFVQSFMLIAKLKLKRQSGMAKISTFDLELQTCMVTKPARPQAFTLQHYRESLYVASIQAQLSAADRSEGKYTPFRLSLIRVFWHQTVVPRQNGFPCKAAHARASHAHRVADPRKARSQEPRELTLIMIQPIRWVDCEALGSWYRGLEYSPS